MYYTNVQKYRVVEIGPWRLGGWESGLESGRANAQRWDLPRFPIQPIPLKQHPPRLAIGAADFFVFVTH
jgi:hypothetical protein